MSIVLWLVSIILLAAGLLQLVETYEDSFHFYIYFIMTVISTVGYGSSFEKTETKIVLVALIIGAIIMIPTKSS